MERCRPSCKQDGKRPQRDAACERQITATCGEPKAPVSHGGHKSRALDTATRLRECEDVRAAASDPLLQQESGRTAGRSSTNDAGDSRYDVEEASEQKRLAGHQQRWSNSLPLPPSRFLLGFQSFSVKEGCLAETPCCTHGDDNRLIRQFVRGQHTLGRSEEDGCRGGGRAERRRQQQGQTDPASQQWRKTEAHTHHQQQQPRWRGQQCPQQQRHREQPHVDKSGYTVTPPVIQLPVSLPSALHADEEACIQPDTDLLPLVLNQGSHEETKEGIRKDLGRPHLTAREFGHGFPAPAAEEAAGCSEHREIHRLQTQAARGTVSPQHKCLSQQQNVIHGKATGKAGAPVTWAPGVRCFERAEHVRHQLAARFQMIKKLRHPHLCAYTHMLRKGQRVYVVSEYWSLSLADLMNQQISRQPLNGEDYARTPGRCCRRGTTDTRTSRYNSVSSLDGSGASANVDVSTNTSCRRGRDCCCAGSGDDSFCCKNEASALFPELFLHQVVRQILSALEYLNSNGIVHARLSLSAIRFDAKGNVRVADWGLQHLTAHGRYAPHAHLYPPLPFVPPETLVFGPFAASTPATAAFATAVPACSVVGLAPGAPEYAAARGTSGSACAASAAERCSTGAASLPASAAVPAATAPERSAFQAGGTLRSSPHSSTGDVCSLGIILLYLLQGPPRTTLLRALPEALQRRAAQQATLRSREGGLLREAEAATQQQKRRTSLQGYAAENQMEARKHSGTQGHTFAWLPKNQILEGQQQMALQQQREGQQGARRAHVKYQQHDNRNGGKRTAGMEDETTRGQDRDCVEGETARESSKGRSVGGQPCEAGKDGQQRMNPVYVGAFPYVWDEWEGHQCTVPADDSHESFLRRGSPRCHPLLLESSDSPETVTCCLRLLRQLERVAFLLLYAHCGYEGVRKTLSSLMEKRQGHRHACRQEAPPSANVVERRAAYFPFKGAAAHAAAATVETRCAATLTQAEVARTRTEEACEFHCSVPFDSYVGQSLRRFYRRRRHVLLEKMRNLVHGPASVIFQADMYDELLQMVSRYTGAERLRPSAHKAAQHKRLSWQQLQTSVRPPAVRSAAAEDMLLESVLAAAVDWLSVTTIWSSHRRQPPQKISRSALRGLVERAPFRTKNDWGAADGVRRGGGHFDKETFGAIGFLPAAPAEGLKGMSPELHDFLSRCLALSPSDRPTPAEALNSEWLRPSNGATVQKSLQCLHAERQRQADEAPQRQRGQNSSRRRNVFSPVRNTWALQEAREPRTLATKEALWCPEAAASAIDTLTQSRASGRRTDDHGRKLEKAVVGVHQLHPAAENHCRVEMRTVSDSATVHNRQRTSPWRPRSFVLCFACAPAGATPPVSLEHKSNLILREKQVT